MKAELIQSMGSDLTVVNAARVSFDKESSLVCCGDIGGMCCGVDYECGGPVIAKTDVRLIEFLARNDHFTPFTHTAITLRETVPIFVARQRFKHTVGFSYNEVSRRYVDTPPEFFQPQFLRGRAADKKQGSSDRNVMTSGEAGLSDFHEHCLAYYQDLLDSGVAPEQARMVLPQSMMTSYYVTGSLAAFARAHRLRSKPDAQLEIQELAKEWDRLISPLFPHSWRSLRGSA